MRKNSRKTTAFLLSVLAISGASVWARGKKSVYKLADIQIYGTQQISDEEVKEKFEPKIRAWFESRSRGTKKDDARAADLRAKLVADVKKFGDFGWARLTESEVASERNVKMILLMFDVIEKQHMATRFPFRSPPSGSVKDGTMMTSSPSVQFTGVATLWPSVSCRLSIRRSTSSKFRPALGGSS